MTRSYSDVRQCVLLSASVRVVLQEYGIADQIGLYILDNANANNNTAVESLEADRRSEANGTRLRCLGHIINLVVKQLYSTETNAMGKITDLINFINNSTFTKARWELSEPNSTTPKSAYLSHRSRFSLLSFCGIQLFDDQVDDKDSLGVSRHNG